MYLKSHLEDGAGKSQQHKDLLGKMPKRYGDGELAWNWNAKGRAHPTFLIDCASGKPLPQPVPSPPPPQRPHLGPIPPPMETYILFCWDLPRPPWDLSQRGEDEAESSKPLSEVTQSLAPSPVSQSKSKAMPSKSFLTLRAWDTVKGSLKAFCSCICGQEN
ncbi:steroid receptor-associated and regulated protein isoform X1 [Antechinus flavipes]|uniref:steroid receptor-associated and regulated protein isoform X1 n=1 Tax=Antechinus flavipes TaxID=38775 RepID=UPI00223654ED|nr:steroid receptor-associated and regulated protein isoform X1 [Antechinus flavipes]